jgi:hypothetical protein
MKKTRARLPTPDDSGYNRLSLVTQGDDGRRNSRQLRTSRPHSTKNVAVSKLVSTVELVWGLNEFLWIRFKTSVKTWNKKSHHVGISTFIYMNVSAAMGSGNLARRESLENRVRILKMKYVDREPANNSSCSVGKFGYIFVPA